MTIKVGLDFGTSNSGVALWDGTRVRLLPVDRRGVQPEVVKTILYITRDYEAYIGQEAIELYYRHNVDRQRHYVRQRAGEIEYTGADMHYVRDVYVFVDELQPGRLLQYLKTALRKQGARFQGTHIFERHYAAGDLVQTYLSQLKQRAEQVLGEKISGATLGRPVKFSNDPALDIQAEETLRQAALAAGFEQVDFEFEPVAAALFYEQSLTKPETVLVFDFGGGTLDIAIMRLGEQDRRVVYASGGIDIAGSDFDRAIIEQRLMPFFGAGQVAHQPELLDLIAAVPEWAVLPEMATPINRNVLEKAIRTGMVPVRLRALQTLIYNDLAFSFYYRVEAAKITLSSLGAAVIALDDPGIDLWELYTRNQFEADIESLRAKIEAVLLETLAASGLEPGQIEAVVKTGGSSNIPLFSEMLGRIFGPEKIKASNAFSSVAAGLAIKAGNR
ncbi:MAG: Hsp70 family protein [Anaerolineales bacterium]|nr:Hsp70 family protein [Anaerolineales bacterium]